MRKRFAIVLAAVVTVLAPRLAWPSPYDTFGTGPRAVAMGGAYAAVGGDAAGLYYNIATITKAANFQLEFGYHRAEMNMLLNGRRTDIDPDRGLNVGVIIGKKLFERQFRIGATLFSPDDHFMRIIMPPRTTPIYLRYNNDNHIQGTIAGGAFQIFPWWSVGAGASFLSGNVGGVDFEIRDDTPANGDLHSSVRSGTTPVAGTYFELAEWFSVGFAFRERQVMELNLQNVIAMPDMKVLTDSGVVVFHDGRLILGVTSQTHFSPRQYQFGLAMRPSERLIFFDGRDPLSVDGARQQRRAIRRVHRRGFRGSVPDRARCACARAARPRRDRLGLRRGGRAARP
ncbi:MAG: hypothetical protein M5R36_12265 [Deltaproteobacteria bacterium]|nr:hypothetical protein [Deltaproteobacteria bacterium]